MHSWLRSRLTYANVMSTIAIFVVLGGSAYAAKQITGKQIKNNSVTSADIKNRTIRGKDLAKGVLGSLNTGAREARRARGPNDVPASTAYTNVASITGLQPGSYLLLAKTNVGSTLGAFVACRLTVEQAVDAASRGVRVGGDPPEEISLQLAHTFAAPGTAVLACRGGKGNWTADDSSLIAIRVTTASSFDTAG